MQSRFVLTIFSAGAFCVVLLLSGCRSENPLIPPSVNLDLKGEWIRVLKSGGIAGISLTPDSGYNIHYLLDDQKLHITENANEFPPVHYSILQKNALLSGKQANFLVLSTDDCSGCQLMPEYTINLSPAKDTLFLNEDVFDGFNYTYVRKRSDDWLAATYMGIDPRLCPSPCCGGFLLNIEGLTHTTTAFPAGFKMDFSKKPQKLLVKIAPTPFSCVPRPIVIEEAKLLP